MNWKTKYPTEPGYYWMRNYVLAADVKKRIRPTPEIVQVKTDRGGFLPLYRFGDERQWCVGDFVSAEWQGPIEPILISPH